MKLKLRIKQLDDRIESYNKIILDYPNCEIYKENLCSLKLERDKLASSIGTNKIK